MGDLGIYAALANSDQVNLGSVVQALRCNTSSTLLAVRHGSDWFFGLSEPSEWDRDGSNSVESNLNSPPGGGVIKHP